MVLKTRIRWCGRLVTVRPGDLLAIRIPPQKFSWHPAAPPSLYRSRGLSGSPERSRLKPRTDTVVALDGRISTVNALQGTSRGTRKLC
jgi:hypothetical protein